MQIKVVKAEFHNRIFTFSGAIFIIDFRVNFSSQNKIIQVIYCLISHLCVCVCVNFQKSEQQFSEDMLTI